TFSGANTYSGPTKMSGGTLTLDFNDPNAIANNITSNIINSASALNFSGQFSALIVNFSSAGPVSQAFNGTTVAANTQATVGANFSGITLNLGAFTRGARSTVNFLAPSGTTITATGLPAISN